jgi:AmiR/NasT family two-component response regulator
VIYLTAYLDQATIDAAKITKPYGYILKPYDEQDLQTTLEMALYKHAFEKQLLEKEKWLSVTLQIYRGGGDHHRCRRPHHLYQ